MLVVICLPLEGTESQDSTIVFISWNILEIQEGFIKLTGSITRKCLSLKVVIVKFGLLKKNRVSTKYFNRIQRKTMRKSLKKIPTREFDS